MSFATFHSICVAWNLKARGMRRPVASLYAAYTATSGDQGAVTSEQDVVAVAVFSEPVTGLSPASFKLAGPNGAAVTALKLLRGTSSYYHALLALPPSYYGPVTLSLAASWPSCPLPSCLPLSHCAAALRLILQAQHSFLMQWWNAGPGAGLGAAEQPARHTPDVPARAAAPASGHSVPNAKATRPPGPCQVTWRPQCVDRDVHPIGALQLPSRIELCLFRSANSQDGLSILRPHE